ncbi:acyl carrier protein [Streptomyces sp. NPDC058794]|uniref:acyl carrier protein n=1 Tax=unclassified Streptomyces TaxID=2593676 RepID=UPI0036BE57A1
MYDRLVTLLTEEFGIDADCLRPQATVRDLDVDSLMLAEIAVILSEETGVRVDDLDGGLSLDSNLEELAEAFAAAMARGSEAATV